MLLDALQTTINPVLDAHLLIGDFEAELPFCVYKAEPQPMRDKEGVSDYIYTVEVGIIDTNPDDVDNYTESIITAVLAMAGQTINSTVITEVLHSDESGFYYSNDQGVYMNDLEFKVFTKNR